MGSVRIYARDLLLPYDLRFVIPLYALAEGRRPGYNPEVDWQKLGYSMRTKAYCNLLYVLRATDSNWRSQPLKSMNLPSAFTIVVLLEWRK